MQKTLLIDQGILFTRIAVIHEGVLQQFHLKSSMQEDLTNTVIQGRVKDIVKNLQAVFVDYGEQKSGFLHLKHIPECFREKLNQGMRIPVQIARENIGDKGHKLTSYINIPGRYVVCLVFEKDIVISKKIRDQVTKEALKTHVLEKTQGKYGFIVRTQAKDIPIEVLDEEIERLMQQADKLIQNSSSFERGIVLYQEKDIVKKVIEEQIVKDETVAIAVNDEEVAKYIQQEYGQHLVLKCYPKTENLINLYGILNQYEELTRRKVWLKNGANIMIDHTEAMHVIDVNSAKAIVKKNREKAIFEINQLAVKKSIDHIINRNLSGIIVLDLVEMKDKGNQEAIYKVAKDYINARQDSRTTVYPLSPLGLLQLSRTKKHIGFAGQIYTAYEKDGQRVMQYSNMYTAYLLEIKIRQIANNSCNERLYVRCDHTLLQYVKSIKFEEEIKHAYQVEIEYVEDSRPRKERFEIRHYI